mmetsp:Transcript_7403/g.16837  ORF Transcript_7403/g.16837 Transcript_7403/m.16837 type:complete len:294 (-) Transcript_7403:90-971(-)|eukprot:CAMPEP_0116826638 /NCGR_PEP_ID=MMETSP0418-20121206/2641_1 /TAXON_ID=1158023 /ORGANISM="Astrosyne radiata, Strain 13vi08-1A" /LENGTH=293 /DNA_ID=CAMNT_0004455297 /DNA_START=130 /DNA_END=1011 /DNA_ORIENTATION=-
MSTTEEATVNPDGSTTFESDQTNQTFGGGDEEVPPPVNEETIQEAAKGTDPAVYLGLVVLLLVVMYFVYRLRSKKEEDDFFSDLDGEKFNLKLPEAVEEYYQIKAKCESAGWKPGEKPPDPNAPQSGPHRVMAQALMKRCIADIPIVTHIQKESTGMNKLYAQSMCSVKQWRAYQSAEAMVSAEVDEVRAEADEIEPGWSQVIWRQAMQYHNMLKQKHEMEAKEAKEAAKKKKQIEDKVSAEKQKEDDEKARELAAQKAAEELIKAEEREKASKKAFSGKGMKKGFLNNNKKK